MYGGDVFMQVVGAMVEWKELSRLSPQFPDRLIV